MRVFKYFRESKKGLSHTIPLSPTYPIYPNLIPKGQMVLGSSLFYEFTLAPRSGSRPYNSAMGSLRKGVDYVKSRIGKDSPSERSEGGVMDKDSATLDISYKGVKLKGG